VKQIGATVVAIAAAGGRRAAHATMTAIVAAFSACGAIARRPRLALSATLTLVAGLAALAFYPNPDVTPPLVADAAGMQPMTRVEASPPAGTSFGWSTNGQPQLTGMALTRALQAGLRQAECYDGPVNGFWTSRSKEGMRRFVAAINARLPVETPDQVLLALIEANPTASCSSAQPAAAQPAPAPARTNPEVARAGTAGDQPDTRTDAQAWAPVAVLPLGPSPKAPITGATNGDASRERPSKAAEKAAEGVQGAGTARKAKPAAQWLSSCRQTDVTEREVAAALDRIDLQLTAQDVTTVCVQRRD
jgi:hypothetical protein